MVVEEEEGEISSASRAGVANCSSSLGKESLTGTPTTGYCIRSGWEDAAATVSRLYAK